MLKLWPLSKLRGDALEDECLNRFALRDSRQGVVRRRLGFGQRRLSLASNPQLADQFGVIDDHEPGLVIPALADDACFGQERISLGCNPKPDDLIDNPVATSRPSLG